MGEANVSMGEGLVLTFTEMTGSVTMLLPMLSACAVAMLVATLLREPPIYESLRERALPTDKPMSPTTASEAEEEWN